jgi:hypothetical protein
VARTDAQGHTKMQTAQKTQAKHGARGPNADGMHIRMGDKQTGEKGVQSRQPKFQSIAGRMPQSAMAQAAMPQSAMAQAAMPQSAMPRCRNLQCWPKSIAEEDRNMNHLRRLCLAACGEKTDRNDRRAHQQTQNRASSCLQTEKKKKTGGLKEPKSQSTGAVGVHVVVRDVSAWNSQNAAVDGL